MSEQTIPAVKRKLITILAADVAEYSRLMSEDEEQTLGTFADYLERHPEALLRGKTGQQ